MTENAEVHPHKRGPAGSLTFSVLTVSSTRGLDQDSSGDLIARMVKESGHTVGERRVAVDDVSRIRETLKEMLAARPDIIIVDGGTGVTPKDVTVEAVRPLLEKEMGAFSTLFAVLSFDQIGAAAILSRACAGIIGRTALFCIPGSSKACQLALARIILPEATHLMAHVKGTV